VRLYPNHERPLAVELERPLRSLKHVTSTQLPPAYGRTTTIPTLRSVGFRGRAATTASVRLGKIIAFRCLARSDGHFAQGGSKSIPVLPFP
jgi:hypothetical protein